MKALFVDLDCLVKVENKAWVVDKSKPNIPIMKLPKEDFNLFKSGIYKSQGNKIDFNGKTFWLPDEVFQKLKVKLKNNDSSLGNLAISMQEFLNKELIENLDFKFNEDMLQTLKNLVDDIYIVCSRQSKSSYQKILDKLEEEFTERGIKIKKFYHITETFYNQTNDDLLFRKARLYLQHLVGYKTDGLKFIDVELDRYDTIKVFDDNKLILNLSDELNVILKSLLSKSSDSMSRIIKENIDDFRPKIEINLLTDNELNKAITNKVNLDYSNLIRSFEKFTYFSNKHL